MNKAIKKFWGIGLIVIILSSFFAMPVASASGAVYSWAQDTTQPSVSNLLFSPVNVNTWGITDIASTTDGATVYAVASNTAGTNNFYKSTNGGTSWSKPSGGTASSPFAAALPNNSAVDQWTFVAVAPDDPNIVAVADYTTSNTTIYLSINGGNTFSSLSYPNASLIVTDLAISAISGPYRYIAVAGNVGGTTGYLYSWNYGSAAPAWTNKAGTVGGVNVGAVAFSPSFPSDNTMLFVSATSTTVTLHCYSYNTNAYDSLVDSSWPRVVKAGTAPTLNRANITLDPAFYMGDTASQIGFVGTAITDTTEVGGVSRISTYTVASGVFTMTKIMDTTAIGSVAWDGTNLAAAPYNVTNTSDAAITIYRSTDALSSSLPTFTPSSGAKAPGAGYDAKLLWNAGNLLCVSQGYSGGVARSADLGKSFNGIGLINTAWTTITDFQVTSDGTAIFVVTDDGSKDINVWRYQASSWQRVMLMAGATGQSWAIRLAASDPTAVFLGKLGATNMFVSTDSGQTKWTARSCSKSIQDFAAETASIVYAIDNSTNVVKSTNGAFTWGGAVNSNIGLIGGGNQYSLTLVKAGNLLIGGTAGTVAYSSDSAATWSQTSPTATGAGSVVATATGFGTGDTIYATDSASNAMYKWVIGSNSPVTGWTVGNALSASGTGLQLVNSVLYVQATSASNNLTWRDIVPNVGISASYCDNVSNSVAFSNNATNTAAIGLAIINSLKASTTATSTTLWAVTQTKLYSWTEYLALAANAPATTFPTKGYMVPVNSLNGDTSNFVFQWSQPSNQNGAVSSAQTYAYGISVYLDSAGTIQYSTGTVAANPAPTESLSAALLSVSNFTPGTTYYWRVRTTSPVTSQWTPMMSYTVQAIASVVPAIVSPANGATIANVNPAFSWTPVSGTTQYDFQLSTTPTFGTTVLTDQPNTAGDLVPVTIPLTQGKQYFWRVRALQPVQGDWSAVANFVVAAPTTAAPAPVTITNVPAPVITIPAAQPAPTYTLAPAPVNQIAPSYIWAIIVVGGILVIAVIVLIVRTRRSV